MITVKDLATVHRRREARTKEVFEQILASCCKQIKRADEVKRMYCAYEVPEFQLGQPLYDLGECITYVMSKLTAAGFQVQYVFPRVLVVSWMSVAPPRAPPPTPATTVMALAAPQQRSPASAPQAPARAARRRAAPAAHPQQPAHPAFVPFVQPQPAAPQPHPLWRPAAQAPAQPQPQPLLMLPAPPPSQDRPLPAELVPVPTRVVTLQPQPDPSSDADGGQQDAAPRGRAKKAPVARAPRQPRKRGGKFILNIT